MLWFRDGAIACLPTGYRRAMAVIGLAALLCGGVSSAAEAACTTTQPGGAGTTVSYSCAADTATTATTNTSPANATTSDRTQSFATGITGQVNSNVAISGNGIELLSSSTTPGDTITMTNNGSITSATGAQATLALTGSGSNTFGTFTYSGTGNVANTATTNNSVGLAMTNATGSGNTATVSGTSTISSTGDFGLVLTTGGTNTLTVQSGGQVSGVNTGAIEVAGATNTVTINGTVTGTGTGSVGILSTTSIGLTNSGSVKGVLAGAENSSGAFGVTNNLAGLIMGTGTGSAGILAGEAAQPGFSVNASNAGTIEGDGFGIQSSGLVTLSANSGTVAGTGTTGTGLTGASVTITSNAGTISGSGAGDAVASQSGDINVTNSGAITGGTTGDGIHTVNANNITLTNNAGTVSGGVAAIVGGADVAITNSATITDTTTAAGVLVNTAGLLTLTNNAAGVIQSTATGLSDALSSATINLTNAGTITTATNSSDTTLTTIGIFTGSGTITNSGAIKGNGEAIELFGSAATTITNQSGGTIQAFLTGNSAAILGASGALTVNNAGTISAALDGINNSTTATTSITNSGTIAGTGRSGVRVAAASIANYSGGTITGVTGIVFRGASGGPSTITNNGTIAGTGANAIDASAGTSAMTLNQQGGAINGNILLSTHGDLVDMTGGAINGSITGQSAGGTVTFDTGFTGTYGANVNFAITNINTLNVKAGTVILDGAANSNTATLVSGGLLVVGDASHTSAAMTSGSVTVGGGTLGGYGTVIGTINNTGGMVQPGGISGTIGTLHQTGNFTQGAGGTTVIEINPTTAAKLAVSGTASLGGTLRVVYDPGSYSATSYTILTAASHSGTFATTTGNTPTGVTQSVDYSNASLVALDLAGSGVVSANSSSVVTTNTAVLGDTNNLALTSSFDSNDVVFDHLDEVAQASDGVKTALAARAPLQIAANGPMSQIAQLGSSMPNMISQFGGWVRGIGDFQSADNQGAVAGYSASGGGFLAGLDHQWDAWTLGIAGGYSGTNFKQKDGSTGDIQTPRVMAYARFQPNPSLVFDGVAGFAYDNIHTSRPIAALSANATQSHHGTEENLALQAGYRMPWQGVTVIPRIGAQYVHLAQGGFSESGASGFDLSAPSSHLDSFRPIFSLAALQTFTLSGDLRITPELKIAYSHEVLSTAQTLALTTPAGSPITGTTLTPARDTITIGPQVTVKMTDRLSLYADYKAVIGVGKSLDEIVFAGARFAW